LSSQFLSHHFPCEGPSLELDVRQDVVIDWPGMRQIVSDLEDAAQGLFVMSNTKAP
jgi:hypothetical protein